MRPDPDRHTHALLSAAIALLLQCLATLEAQSTFVASLAVAPLLALISGEIARPVDSDGAESCPSWLCDAVSCTLQVVAGGDAPGAGPSADTQRTVERVQAASHNRQQVRLAGGLAALATAARRSLAVLEGGRHAEDSAIALRHMVLMQQAAWAFAHLLAAGPATGDEEGESAFAPTLAGLLRLRSPSAAIAACAAVGQICRGGTSRQDAVRSAGAIPAIVELLRSGKTETLQLHALAALSAAVASNPAGQNVARDAGALRVVVALLADTRYGCAGYGSWELLVPQHSAMCAMYLIANNPTSQAALREAGGAAALSALARSPGGVPQVGEAARTAQSVLQIIEPPAPPPVEVTGAEVSRVGGSTGTRSRVVVPVDETEMGGGTTV